MVEKDTERRKARENVRAASQSLEPSEVMECVNNGSYTMEDVESIVRCAIAVARVRARAYGGRVLQYKSLGLQRKPREDAELEELRAAREKARVLREHLG